MPLILQGLPGVMTSQLYPVPGTINPTYVTGRISPVSGFCARRAPFTRIG
jgi:hypothetical protein